MTHRIMDWQSLQQALPKRRSDADKSHYGHVLIIGGDYGMGGAVRMAAEAAYRVGAGLVSVATRVEHVDIVSVNRPEIMCHHVNTGEDLLPFLLKASVVVIGPGLGKAEWGNSLLDQVLMQNKPTLLDADALNLLSQHPQQADHWILTPHPGEASRLLNTTVDEIQADRLAAANALQQQYGGVVILKGAGTLVQAPEQTPALCLAGNPGMGSGGMGDVLSGVIGGLLAQHLTLTQAAEVGVMVHAMAGDRAAEKGERGLLATDLMSYLRELVNPTGSMQ